MEYFISYYDYYQPEAYVVKRDLYIEKDASINDDIDQMRHSAVSSLMERDDVIVVASVSCIYGIGAPEDYKEKCSPCGSAISWIGANCLKNLSKCNTSAMNMIFKRGSFRVKGEYLDIIPANVQERAYRIEFFDDEIEKLRNTIP